MPIQAGCLGVRRTYEKECNNAVLDFLNQPLSGTSSLILVAVLAVVIFVAIKLGHKKARDISKQFLTEHPNAATLYLYGEDLPSNSAELDCIQGTVSKVYDPRTVPGAKAQKGVACHVLPGKVELNVMITWSKSYYVARKHGSMQAHFTFEAMPGRSYAAVFNVKDSSAKIISLDTE